MRLNAPDAARRPRPDRGAARHPRGRRRHRHRRDDDVQRRRRERARARARGRCSPRRSPRSPTRRSGTAARSAARWCTPTRPATSGPRCWRSTPSSSSRARAASARSPASDFFEDLFETAVGEGELLTAVRIPKHTGWGVALREVRAGLAPVVDRRGRRDGQGRRRHDQRGPDRADQHGLDAAARPCRRGRRWSAGRRPTRRRRLLRTAADGTNPPTDLNGDADYRRHLATVLTRRAVARRPRRLSPHGADARLHRPGRASTTPGPRSWTSSGWAAASPARP